MEVKGKQILVVGYGISGQAAAKLLLHHGASVVALDEGEKKPMKRRARRKKTSPPIQINFGADSVPKMRFDAAILSPGLHPKKGLAKKVLDLDIPIYGELELASWFCECPIVAITGTNGKTTTTELVEAVIRANRKKTIAAGNIGLPLSEAAMKSQRLDYLTVEVSSFQLESIVSFRPKVSVLLNITPDHMDRYSSMADYAKTKADIWKNQKGNDVAVINLDTERYLSSIGCSSPRNVIRYSIKGEEADLTFKDNHIQGPLLGDLKLDLNATQLRGAHNAENIMAALSVVAALGLNVQLAWKAICKYKPLPHRLESVAKIGGVEFIDDSKATNVDAMEKAITSFTKPVVLIAGGKDKGFDFADATPTIQKQVKACVLIGEMRHRMYECWKDATNCIFAQTMDEAVEKAAELSEPGDVVLLSPGCSSFDMFKNYEDRGKRFRQAVSKLNKS